MVQILLQFDVRPIGAPPPQLGCIGVSYNTTLILDHINENLGARKVIPHSGQISHTSGYRNFSKNAQCQRPLPGVVVLKSSRRQTHGSRGGRNCCPRALRSQETRQAAEVTAGTSNKPPPPPLSHLLRGTCLMSPCV